MSSVTIRSQAEYNGKPIWTLEFTDTSKDRALSLRVDNTGESVLLWRITDRIVKKDKAINLLGCVDLDLSLITQAGYPQDVILAKLDNEFFLQKGFIPIQSSKNGFPPVFRPLSMLLGWNMFEVEDLVKLKLHAEGLVFDLYLKKFDDTQGDERFSVLLTVNGVGDLILRPAPVPDKDSKKPKRWKPLVDAIEELTKLRSTAQWCDWLWQRTVTDDDLRIPVVLKKESEDYVLKIISDVIDLSPSLLRTVLRDQRPESELPPLSRMEFDPQCVRISVAWQPKLAITSLTLSRGKEEGGLTYEFSDKRETLRGGLALCVSPMLLERIQALRTDGKVKRGFIPVHQGWLQLPLTNSANEKVLSVTLEGRVVRDDGDHGVFEIGTRRAERESASTPASVRDTMPWSMCLRGFDAFRLTFTIDRTTKAPKISKISGNFFQPKIRLRGLLWMAIGRPDDDDLLPQLELGNSFMRDMEFETLEKVNDYWTVELSDLELTAETDWPKMAFSTIELSKLTAPLVLWGRHPTLPGIQVQPLTSAREAPARSLGSRELLPLKLVGQTLVDQTSLKLKNLENDWPELIEVDDLEFWWPRITPLEGAKSWIEGPEIKRGFPLVALSMPGVEFWFKSNSREYKYETALRMDLPYSDEMYANARHPKQGEIQNEPIPDLAFDADDAIQELWLGRHDAWMLSLGKGTLLVDRNESTVKAALLPGFPWVNGSISIYPTISLSKDKALCFGSVDFMQNKTSIQKLSGSKLLEGLSVNYKLSNQGLALDESDPNLPKILGFALPLMTFDGERVDADGTLSKAFDVENGEQVVRVAGQPFTRLTLKEPITFRLNDVEYAFWCRELPCKVSGSSQVFDRSELCEGDALPPPLAGFEWRIYRQNTTADSDLPFNAHFQLRAFSLKRAERKKDIWTLTLHAWLKPTVRPDLRLGEVEVKLNLNDAGKVISSIKAIDALIWPLNNLTVDGKNHTRTWQRDPWIELWFCEGTTELGVADLHVPLFGYWQSIPLTIDTNKNIPQFKYTNTGKKIPGLSKLELSLKREIENLNLIFELDTAAIAAKIEPTDQSDEDHLHKITFTRFPGQDYSSGQQLSINLAHFDILLNFGFALTYSSNDHGRFLFSPGFAVFEAAQQWSLGIGMGMVDDNLRIQTLCLEGTILGKQDDAEARIDILATIRPNNSGQLQSSFHVRLVGKWTVDSVIDWPKATIEKNLLSNIYDVNFDSIKRQSRMQMHWRGEVLEGETLDVQIDGSILLDTSQSPILLCTHDIFTGESTDAFSFDALHPVFIGTLESLKKRLDDLGHLSVANLNNTNDAKDVLNGFIGSKFTAFLNGLIEDRKHRNVRVVVSTPLLLLGEYPGVFAVMALLDDGEAKSSIANHLNKLGKKIKVDNMDADPKPLQDSVTSHEILIRESEHCISGDDIAPRWAQLDSLPVPIIETDSTWIGVHQQRDSNNSTYEKDRPLLRTMIWISVALNSDKKPKVLTGAMSTLGRYIFFDASRLTYVPRHMNPFASQLPMTDLIVAGEYGLANVRMARKLDIKDFKDLNWLSEAITARLGLPSFAIQRMRTGENSNIIHLSNPRIALAEGAVLRRWSFPDTELGSSRPPMINDKKLAAVEIRTELLHRAPMQVRDLQHTSGTRHLYRVPRMAGSGKQIWQCLQEQVLFAAPRSKAQVASAVRTVWPVLLDSKQLSVEGELKLQQQSQALSHPYRETISFAQRSGIFRTHREGSLLESMDGNICKREQGLSFAHGFRAPRPLSLPENRQCRAVLSKKKLDVLEGVADVAVVPKLPLSGKEKARWLPTLFSLTGPQCGIVKPSWSGVFVVEYFQYAEDDAYLNRSGASGGFTWYATLVVQGKTYELDVATDETKLLRLTLKAFVRPEINRELYGRLLLILAPMASPWPIQEPSVTLEFPLVFVPAQHFNLPMRAYTVTFFDPIFNAALGSEVAYAKGGVTTLLLDRQAYNATGTMVLMATRDDKEGITQIKFERWRRDSRSGALHVDSLLTGGLFDGETLRLIAKVPVRLELGQFRVVDSADTTDVFLPGDMLRVFEPAANGPSVLLAISAEPVLPAPEAAYALWRALSPSRSDIIQQVQCPRYGLGIMPERVDYVDAESDLLAGRMRRSALFRWLIVSPAWEASASYFLQRIDHVGSTHFPKTDDFVNPIK